MPAISNGSDERFNAVLNSIAVAAAVGQLVTGLRPKVGGAIKELPAEWWNTEKLRPRFFMCQMKPADPFSDGVAGNGYCWIFVQAEGLSRFTSPEDISNTTTSDATPGPTDEQQAAMPAKGSPSMWPATSTQVATEGSRSTYQPRRRSGASVQYTTDETIIANVLAVLEREPDHPIAPLITDAAANQGCLPSGGDDFDRLVDRVRRKIRKQIARLAEQRPE